MIHLKIYENEHIKNFEWVVQSHRESAWEENRKIEELSKQLKGMTCSESIKKIEREIEVCTHTRIWFEYLIADITISILEEKLKYAQQVITQFENVNSKA